MVFQGNVHRFRLINANFFDCPFEVTVDNHKLTVISSDGQDVQPVEVDSIVSNSGERFDFLINANQAVNTYWIRVKGTLLCERLQTYQLATLTYDGSSRPLGAGTVPNYNTANNRNSLVQITQSIFLNLKFLIFFIGFESHWSRKCPIYYHR